MIETHPVQANPRNGRPAAAPVCVTLAAYEVYCHIYGPQKELVQEGCRGGFGAGELIAFLYARAYPKEEWRRRFEEAMIGLNV